MYSLTNSNVLSRLPLLVPSVVLMCFSLTVRAELHVEWIDDDTIVVTGYGYGYDDTTNVTALGSCTNCLAISPDEMRFVKSQIFSYVSHASSLCDDIQILLSDISYTCYTNLQDIGVFGRFPIVDSNVDNLSTCEDITSKSGSRYVYGTQGSLSDTFWSSTSLNSQRTLASVIGYANGIYDYATSVVAPSLSSILSSLPEIHSKAESVKSSLNSISNIVRNITEESCDSCGSGGGTNSTSCSSCPCEEQWDALLDYVRHIDDDQHKRFTQLSAISNKVFNINEKFDSYAKLVSGVLYNDSTITLDDGETWTNIYFSGASNGYDYDKSNILQRIELILFGMAYSPTNTFEDLAYSYTNELDDADVENVTNRFYDFSSSISNGFDSAYKDFRAHVNSLKSIDSMFVFWGQAGSASPFTLGQVPDLAGSGSPQYITVGNDFLGSEVPRFRMLCRYAFQLLWAVCFLFMIWEFYVRLFKYVVIFLKYVCEWLNECFAS